MTATLPITPAVFRTHDAARYLAISPWLLRKLVHEGRIRVLPGKYLRFRVVDLDAYLAESVL
jgi:excisionase family DNA binding protein